MYLVINKCVTAVKVSNFSGHYLRNRSTLNIGVLGYIGIVQHKEHSPEVLSIPPGALCITRLASQEIFSASNKIHREVGRAKDLSAPLYSVGTVGVTNNGPLSVHTLAKTIRHNPQDY